MNKISYSYKNEFESFNIEIEELEPKETNSDIRITFLINVKNLTNPSCNIIFEDATGYISNIEDKDKLLNRLKKEINERIDLVGQDSSPISIGDSFLDLRKK